MKRISHNHGPANGRGLDCTEHPVGACLVVIDPEDIKQVERLILALPDSDDWAFTYEGEVLEGIAEPFQAALREFANPTPPKPEEPLGLGAVVIDAAGRRYVRCDQSSTSRWHCADDETGAYDDFYADIPAVRVLSEGVTP